MSSYTEQLSAIAPWRRTASIVLLVAAVAILVLAIAGVIHVAAMIGAVIIVAGSYLVGPKSPFFSTQPA